MPIDPRIIAGFQPQQIDVAGPLQRLQQNRMLRQQEAIQAEQLKGIQLENQAMPARQELAMRKAQLEFQKLSREEQNARIEQGIKQSERLGALAGTVKDEQSKQMAIQLAVNEGLLEPDFAAQLQQMPYDPATYQQFVTQAVSAKDQLAAERQRRADEETARHNRAMEARQPTSELAVWQSQNPGKPIGDFWKEKAKNTPRQPPTMIVNTVDENGNAVTKVVPRQVGAEYAAAPTADMRNREASRSKIVPAINSLEALGKRVITEKTAAIQKAKASGRSLNAYFADDPDYRVYQDARMALAGNLAVAQQGSRPSDADIKAIWLPLVPDAFRDTTESARMKWELIRINSGLQQGQTQPNGGPKGGSLTVGTVQDGYRFKGGDPGKQENWEKVK